MRTIVQRGTKKGISIWSDMLLSDKNIERVTEHPFKAKSLKKQTNKQNKVRCFDDIKFEIISSSMIRKKTNLKVFVSYSRNVMKKYLERWKNMIFHSKIKNNMNTRDYYQKKGNQK